MDLLKDHQNIKHIKLRQLYYDYYYGNNNPQNPLHKISRRAVCNVIKCNGFSKKVSEYRNLNQNPTEGYQYLRRVAHLNPICLFDFDESGTDNDDFGCGKGYALVGEKYIRTQFVVRRKNLTLCAACNYLGVINCFKIFEGPVDEHCILEFLNDLEQFLAPQDIGIADNASIHHTVLVGLLYNNFFMDNIIIVHHILLI